MKTETKKIPRKRRKKLRSINLLCWIVIPLATLGMLVLDGLGLYAFTTERLIVFGVGIAVMLTPFFSEISVSNVSIKKDKPSK